MLNKIKNGKKIKCEVMCVIVCVFGIYGLDCK